MVKTSTFSDCVMAPLKWSKSKRSDELFGNKLRIICRSVTRSKTLQASLGICFSHFAIFHPSIPVALHPTERALACFSTAFHSDLSWAFPLHTRTQSCRSDHRQSSYSCYRCFGFFNFLYSTPTVKLFCLSNVNKFENHSALPFSTLANSIHY